ncbi:glycosyltransferase family 4 protein [Vibrio owensii]|uniref:glycosyltransferase family 4 protein n=1 Tax=Vibrio owensii TaxID=696485 RepID=UPI000596BCA7|nr:glycosyltransferase family 4 protein [Vibrio owensii]
MNVLVFLPDFKPMGPFIVARNIAMFGSYSSEVKFSFLSMRTNNAMQELDEKFECFALNEGKLPSAKALKSLNGIIKDNDIDLVHAHGFWPTILSSYLPKEIKKVVTIHNSPYEDYQFQYGKTLGFVMGSVFNSRLEAFNRVIPISKFVNKSLTSRNIRTHIVYNGVASAPIERVSNDCLVSDCIQFGVVAALIPRKDIFYAIDLVVMLRTSGVCCTFDIVGEGPLESEIKQHINNLKANDYIRLRGTLEHKETLSFIEGLDVFLFTSHSEGFGLVLVESMMLGTLVLARSNGVTSEILGDDVFCFNDEFDFRQKLEFIMNTKDERIDYLYNRYIECFSAEAMGMGYHSVYKEVVNGL